MNIKMPQRPQEQGSNWGQIGSIAGLAAGALAAPFTAGASLATIPAMLGTIGGGALTGMGAGGGIGGLIDSANKPDNSPGPQPVQQNAMQRRSTQMQDGDTYGQLKQGLLASSSLPVEQRQQVAPQLMGAMQKLRMG